MWIESASGGSSLAYFLEEHTFRDEGVGDVNTLGFMPTKGNSLRYMIIDPLDK